MSSLQAAPSNVVHEAVDERQFVRTRLPASISIEIGGQMLECQVDDISLGGASLQCGRDLAVGTLLPARILIHLHSLDLSISCKVGVVARRGTLLGVQFSDMERERRDVLRYLIASYMAGEIADVNGMFNVLQRENYIRQRKQKVATTRTPGERLKAVLGSLVFLGVGILICGLLGYKMFLFFFRVEAAQALVTTDAHIISMPDNGYVHFLVDKETDLVKHGTPIASVSSQLMTSFNTPSDLAALNGMSQADLQTLLGRALIETVISSPCDCYLYSPRQYLDRYAYKYEEMLHLLPATSAMIVKASFPFTRLKDVSEVSSVQMKVFGHPGSVSGTIVDSALDSENQMLVLSIAPSQPLPRGLYLKPAAVEVFTTPAALSAWSS